MTKKELTKKMSEMYWVAYWAGAGVIHGSTDYARFLNELDKRYNAGEISQRFMQWAHEIDSELSRAAEN